MKTVLEIYSEKELEENLAEIDSLLEAGADREQIYERVPLEGIDELIEIARARVRGLEKHPYADRLIFNLSDLRWATPKVVADWRAARVACPVIADIGCGVGFQSFAFAERCKKVIAIELDPRKLAYARENAARLGLTNIEFVQGDALSDAIVEKLKRAAIDVAFCDPERLPEESVRRPESMRPDPRLLIERYSKITQKLVMEYPPQAREIPFDAEREYVSLNGELNRLTLYFGPLKRCSRSVVVLPAQAYLCSANAIEARPIERISAPMTYLYELDEAVAWAALAPELLSALRDAHLYECDEHNCFLTSQKLLASPFFKARYVVRAVCANEFDAIVGALNTHKAGSVVLRMTVPPESYWTERKRYEAKLKGKKELHLFVFDKAVIAEKLS